MTIRFGENNENILCSTVLSIEWSFAIGDYKCSSGIINIGRL